MRYREVVKRLTALRCIEVARKGKGSHRKWVNPETNLGTVIPDWGSKDLKFGTVRGAVRQLGLTWEQFEHASE